MALLQNFAYDKCAELHLENMLKEGKLVLGDIRKIKMVRYCHKIPRYDGLVIFNNILHIYSYFCTSVHQYSH